MTPQCSVCGEICKLSKSNAINAGWNFMDITAPIKGSWALCPKDSKTHTGLFASKMAEATAKLGPNPKRVSIKMQFPTGGQ